MVKAFRERRDFLVKSFGQLAGVKISEPKVPTMVFLFSHSYFLLPPCLACINSSWDPYSIIFYLKFFFLFL